MPWFYIDDDMAFNRKIVAAGNAAVGLWSRAGSWSRKEGTNGFIPTGMAKSLGTASQIKALVDNALWHKVPGGYQFHQWDDRYDQAAEEERKRKRAAAGRLGGINSGKTRRGNRKAEANAEANSEASASKIGLKNEANAEQKRTPVLVLEGSSYEDPEPHVKQRAGKPRGRSRIDEVNGTAHSLEAHNIAKRYAERCRQTPPGDTIRGVALAADGCLRSGFNEHQIDDGIRAWEASTMTSTTRIPDFVHQAVNRSNNPGGQPISKAESWLNLGQQIDDNDRKAIGQ